MLKKLLSIGAALLMGCLCLFCGCDEKIDYLKEYDDGSQLWNVTAETEGAIYSLDKTYEIGFLSQRDLKKIAYFHNEDNEATFPVELSDTVKVAIKNTYAEEYRNDEHFNSREITAEDFTVRSFYGYYYKCCVVTVDSTLWDYQTDVPNYYKEIGGVQFHFTSHGGLTVWIPKNDFYPLYEAYQYGWLNEEDAKSIAYYHNGGREGNESVMSKNYTPKPKTPEVLDDATTAEIKQEYCDMHNSKGYLPVITVDEVGFRYYGCYNGCAVIKIGYDNMPVSDVSLEENIGGIKVFYTGDWLLSVWKQKAD